MPIRIGTHDGRFHADEVMAIAVLLRIYPDAVIIRTRDPSTLATCNIRVDVGRRYDPSTGDFDHHQTEGAGVRKNGIKFSSLGLVWKEFGIRVARDAHVAQRVDEILVQVVDARDNGQNLTLPNPAFGGIRTVEFADTIDLFNAAWGETDRRQDTAFREAVGFAGKMLSRLLKRVQSTLRARKIIQPAIDGADDPRLLVLDQNCPWHDMITNEAPSILFVVYPDTNGRWIVEAVRRQLGSYAVRKQLPKTWTEIGSGSFSDTTGVPDTHFVHNELFLAVAKTRDGALALAQIALAA